MEQSDERLIDLYLDMLAAERGASANTLEAYRRDLADFSNHLGEQDRAIANAGNDDIRSYLGRLAGRGFSAASVARRLSAIRQLYRFLYAEGNRKDDPAAAIEGPKRGRPLPKVLSISHVDQLLGAAREGMDGERPIGERLRAARLTCLLSALRHRPARLRAGDAAGLGGAPRRAHADRARQGQQGASGAAE